jgi:hypothetical protein
MTGMEFASTLITHLLWPLVVAGALVFFRKPLTELVSRVRHYEGLGQSVDFGPGLAEAEDSVDKAVEGVQAPENQAEIEPSPLVREAEANPSFVVLQAWEQLSGAIADIVGAALPGRTGSRNVAAALNELRKRELVSSDFANAVTELRVLRNQVAHGQSKPTPGEAVAYTESAQVLAVIARNIANLIMNPPLMSSGDDDGDTASGTPLTVG